MVGVLSAENTNFEIFNQDYLSMSIKFLLVLYLVFPRSLFNMGPAFMFSRGVETLRIGGYWTLSLLTYGNLAVFRRHHLMNYMDPMPMAKVHSSLETYSYKCASGLTLLIEYLLMQNRYLTE